MTNLSYSHVSAMIPNVLRLPPDSKLLEEYELLPLGKYSEMKREEQIDTYRYMIDGEFRRLSIDNDLHFSISNGLVSKKVDNAAYVYRIFKERPI